MNETKVCLISHYTSLKGANRSLLALIDGIQESDQFSPHAIVRGHGPVVDQLRRRDVPTSVINFPWSVHDISTSSLGYFKNVRKRLRKCIARMRNRRPGSSRITERLADWNIDLVHTNSLVTDIGYYSAQKLGLPHVWHIREYGDRDYGLRPDPGWYVYAQRVAASDQIIVVSEALASYLRTRATLFHTRTRMPNLQVIYNGVIDDMQADQTYEQCHTESIPTESPLFMIIGHVMPSKGQDVAVRAIMKLRQSYPHARLAIVGDGQTDWIEQVVKEEKAENAVELWGYIDDPWEAYAQADVTLVCSESEGMGRVTVEGMIAGTPVIGRDQGGTSELIEHGTTGRLYENGSGDLASEMQWVLSHPTEAKEMVENAREHASRHFTHEHYAESVMQVWMKALKDVKSSPRI